MVLGHCLTSMERVLGQGLTVVFSEVWRATEVKIQWIASSSGFLSFVCWISVFSKRIFIRMSAVSTSSVLILLLLG